jgi:hypothetical protein
MLVDNTIFQGNLVAPSSRCKIGAACFFGILVMIYLMTCHHTLEDSCLYVKFQQDLMKVTEVESRKTD